MCIEAYENYSCSSINSEDIKESDEPNFKYNNGNNKKILNNINLDINKNLFKNNENDGNDETLNKNKQIVSNSKKCNIDITKEIIEDGDFIIYNGFKYKLNNIIILILKYFYINTYILYLRIFIFYI